MSNDQLGPVAERDYPDGSLMILPPEAQARLLKEHKRSKCHRRLIDDATDVDSDGSQGDGPSHASVSRPRSYHDASSGPAHPLDQHHAAQTHDQYPIGSASNTVVLEPAPLQPSLPALHTTTGPPPTSHYITPPSAMLPESTSLPTPKPAPTPQTSLNDFAHHLWLTYSVHEQQNVQLGLPPFIAYGADALINFGMPESEIREFNSCKHAFPHVPQRLFPMIRPDGLPGQYFHLTQIPYGTDVDPVTSLARSYQIVICFDLGYHEMKKAEVQEAAHARFDAMGIPLTSRFREPVFALIHHQSKAWLGFLKVDLQNPEKDAIALLKRERIFTLQLQSSIYVIGKVEKGFDFPSTANNRRLGLQSPTLSTYTSRHLLRELIRLGYLVGYNLEFIGVAKRSLDQDTAEIIVASETTKQYLLQTPIFISGVKVSI
jgi:hypothetical protein